MISEENSKEVYSKIKELGLLFQEEEDSRETKLKLADSLKLILHMINEGHTSEEILDHVFSLLDQIIQFDRLSIALLDKDEKKLSLLWVKSKFPIRNIQKGFYTSHISESLKQILETNEPRIINDLTEYFDTHPQSETTPLILSDEMRSNLTCPLRANGKNIGVIFFSSKVPFTYTSRQIATFKEISEAISLIIKSEVDRQ